MMSEPQRFLRRSNEAPTQCAESCDKGWRVRVGRRILDTGTVWPVGHHSCVTPVLDPLKRSRAFR